LAAHEKTATQTCKITLPDSPHPLIVSKEIPDSGHCISLDGMKFFSFNKYIFFPFLAAGFCPKNLAFARKMLNCPSAAPPPPGSYAYAN